MPRFPSPAIAYAEYVVAGSRQVARIPDGTTDVAAGALPLAVLTAWQAVVDTLHIREGSRLQIHAASGGVGHLAVQIAKARGAEVWGTASERNHEALRELGVDHVIDYRSERFEDVATEMDAVIDLVGTADNALRSVRSLRRGGRLVIVPSPSDLPSRKILHAAGVTATWILVEPDYAALEEVARMLEAGTLRVVVGDTRPLDQIAELHAIGEAGPPTASDGKPPSDWPPTGTASCCTAGLRDLGGIGSSITEFRIRNSVGLLGDAEPLQAVRLDGVSTQDEVAVVGVHAGRSEQAVRDLA